MGTDLLRQCAGLQSSEHSPLWREADRLSRRMTTRSRSTTNAGSTQVPPGGRTLFLLPPGCAPRHHSLPVPTEVEPASSPANGDSS